MRIRPYYPFVLAMSLLPALALATDGSTADFGGNLMQLIFGFALILALLFATLWLLKKLTVPRGAPGSMVRVVSAASVGPRERVVLVDVGEKRLVLGVAPGRVALLDAQAVPAATPAAAQENTAAMPAFAQRLRQILARHSEK